MRINQLTNSQKDMEEVPREKNAKRDEYRMVLQSLPDSTVKKWRQARLETPEAKAHAVSKLTAKHSVEIAELDWRGMSWSLVRVAPDSVSADRSEQWDCRPNKAKAGCADVEYGWRPCHVRRVDDQI